MLATFCYRGHAERRAFELVSDGKLPRVWLRKRDGHDWWRFDGRWSAWPDGGSWAHGTERPGD